MEIRYTKHAKYQIGERKIEQVWIEETLRSPDKIFRDGHKYYVTKKLNGFTLRIVYVRENYIKIVTLYWI